MKLQLVVGVCSEKSTMSKVYRCHVIILGRLGRGATSHVFRVQSTRTRKLYAMKVIDKKGVRYDRARLERELDLQGGLCHPNVVQLIKHLEDSDNHYVLTQYCEQGEITRLILLKLPQKQLACLITQIAKGLQYLHDNGVAHCDLKLSNLLLHQGKIKLCDFGYSQRIPLQTCTKNSLASKQQSSQPASSVEINSRQSPQTLFGTLFYMAPEMLSSKQRILYREADVWAFGISILILVTQKQPYTGFTTRQIRQQILNNQRSPIPSLSLELTALLQGLLEPNPSLRLTLSQILQHQFLKKYSCEDINIQIKVQKEKLRSTGSKKNIKSESQYKGSEQKNTKQAEIKIDQFEQNTLQISKADLGYDSNHQIIQNTDKKYLSAPEEQESVQQIKLQLSRKIKKQENTVNSQCKIEQIKSLPIIGQAKEQPSTKWRFKRLQTLPQSAQSTVDKRTQRVKAPDSEETIKGRIFQLQKIDARLLSPLKQFFYRTRNDGYVRVKPKGMMQVKVRGLEFTIDKAGQSLCLGGRTFSLVELRKNGKNGEWQQLYELYEYALQLVRVICGKKYSRCWQETWKGKDISVGLRFNGELRAVGESEGEMFMLQLNIDGQCDLSIGQKQSIKVFSSELPSDFKSLHSVLLQKLQKIQ